MYSMRWGTASSTLYTRTTEYTWCPYKWSFDPVKISVSQYSACPGYIFTEDSDNDKGNTVVFNSHKQDSMEIFSTK